MIAITIALNILKIIGIILLILLGLILLILALVLFVPVRYRLDGAVPEDKAWSAGAEITWLLRILRVSIRGSGEGVLYSVRLLWFRLAGNEPEEKSEAAPPGEAQSLPAPEEDLAVKEPHQTLPEPGMQDEESGTQEEVPATQEEASGIQAEAPGTSGTQDAKSETKDGTPEIEDEVSGLQDEKDPKVEEKDLLDRVDDALVKIGEIRDSLAEKAQKGADLKKKAEEMPLKHYLTFGLDLVKRILLHIRPRKLEGSADYGFADDYKTGQVTSYAAALYPLYGKHVAVTPHFDREILQGDLRGEGRIYVAFLVWQVIRILVDKDMRKLVLSLIRKK